MTKMVDCPACQGAGFNSRGTDCGECNGHGKIAQRMLSSPIPGATYFRGALVKPKIETKGKP